VFTLTELRVVVVLIGMLTLPGWAMLTFVDVWCHWKGLQRWILAVGLSIAFYPVFFYVVRTLLPFLTVGPYKMGALLFAFAAMAGWRMRRQRRGLFTFDRLEWVAIVVFGMTLFTRFWIIRDRPYPAWSDSLHHTLLTHLTAVQGKLPADMMPYFPIPLGQYHLGLYALSATVQWLAQVPAHTALLWAAQMLNGLCGVGVYLVLDQKVGRVGAVVGAAVVGLFSHQPAIYVNWGRFTQMSSQTLILIAWLVTWETIVLWKRLWQGGQEDKFRLFWPTVFSAMLTSAVFLLHFRVAIFYLPLLMISIAWELWKVRQENRVVPVILGTIVIGLATLILTAPALWEAIRLYIATKQDVAKLMQSADVAKDVSEAIKVYNRFPWRTVPYLVARPWLLVVTGIGILLGLLRRNKLVFACLMWTGVLYLIAQAYLVGLDITNLGAVLIMLYLPSGLVIGSAAEAVVVLLGMHRREQTIRLIVALVLVVGFVASHLRATEIEPYRHFITPADIAAMDWIRENTPPDALFAVNTFFWLPTAPHGTDAGYWIPYFTGRQTTAGVMVLSLGTKEYVLDVVEVSRLVEQLEVDDTSLAELQALGVDYVYVGQKGDFSGPGLNAARLGQAEDLTLVYENSGVSVLQLQTPDRTN
jgi:hypothetical protein